MRLLSSLGEAASQLFFPHHCAVCGTDMLNQDTEICWHCLGSLPATNFASLSGNPLEKIFWGRLSVQAATALYFYTQNSLLQKAMHAFKYHRNQALGIQLGRILGETLLHSGRFQVDLLVPVPLHPRKEKQRGFNQAAVICEGIRQVMKIPFQEGILRRPKPSTTQTNKGRIDRWTNMEGTFVVSNSETLAGKHCLLIDDVITTGATLESCGIALLKVDNVKISIASLGTASQ
ncbi:MAG: ComF family protein [Chitinophagaceae bacterium]